MKPTKDKVIGIEIPNQRLLINKEAKAEHVTAALRPHQTNFEQLIEHIKNGQPYSPNLVEKIKGRRRAEGFVKTHLLVFDSDDNASLSDILNPANPLAQHISLIAPSPSDRPEYRKLRVIMQLAASITDPNQLRSIYRSLITDFGYFGVIFDMSCTDPTRWYYSKEVNLIETVKHESNFHLYDCFDGIAVFEDAIPFHPDAVYTAEDYKCKTTKVKAVDPEKARAEVKKVLDDKGIGYKEREGSDAFRTRFMLERCPITPDHGNKTNPQILVTWDGGVFFKCHGGRCKGKSNAAFLSALSINKQDAPIFNQTRRAYSLPTFNPDAFEIEHVNAKYISEAVDMPAWVDSHDAKVLVLCSALGTGKTQAATELVKHYSQRGETVLCITPRRTLADQTSERHQIHNYQGEHKRDFEIPKPRTICMPSLVKLKDEDDFFHKYEVIIIDEVSSMLDYFPKTASGLLRTEDPAVHGLEMMQALQALVKNANKVILSEACLHPTVLAIFLRLAGLTRHDVKIRQNDYQAQLPVRVWALDNHSDQTAETRDSLQVALLNHTYQRAIESNGVLAIATDTIQTGKALCRFAIEEWGMDASKVLFICAETKTNKDVHQFLLNPDDFIRTEQPKLIIYNAAMDTGFSITEPCVVLVLATAPQHILSATQIMQMTARVRNPIGTIDIMLDERPRGFNDIDPFAMSQDIKEQIAFQQHKLNNHAEMDEAMARSIDVSVNITAIHNQSRVDYTESVPAHLTENGYNVECAGEKDIETLLADVTDKDALLPTLHKRNSKREALELVSESERVSDKDIQTHRKANTTTEAIIAGNKKERVANLLGDYLHDDTNDETDEPIDKPPLITPSHINLIEATIDLERDDETVIVESEGKLKLHTPKRPIVSGHVLGFDQPNERGLETAINNVVHSLRIHKRFDDFDRFCRFHAQNADELNTGIDYTDFLGAPQFRRSALAKHYLIQQCLNLIDAISTSDSSWIGTGGLSLPNNAITSDVPIKLDDAANIQDVDQFIKNAMASKTIYHPNNPTSLLDLFSAVFGVKSFLKKDYLLQAVRHAARQFFYKIRTPGYKKALSAKLLPETLNKLDATGYVAHTTECGLQVAVFNSRTEPFETGGVVCVQLADGRIGGIIARRYESIEIDRGLEELLKMIMNAEKDTEQADDAAVEDINCKVTEQLKAFDEKTEIKQAKEQIIPLLENAGQPMTSKEIHEAVGLVFNSANKRYVSRLLNRHEDVFQQGSKKNRVYFIRQNQSFSKKVDNKKRSVLSNKNEMTPVQSAPLPVEKQKTVPEVDSEGIIFVDLDATLQDALSKLNVESGLLGADFETYAHTTETDLFNNPVLIDINEPHYYRSAVPRVLSLSDGKMTVVIDLPKLNDMHPLKSFIDPLTVICHNAVFESVFFDKLGITPRQIICTMIAETFVRVGSTERRTVSLADCVNRYLGITLDKTEQTADWSPENDITEHKLKYAAQDSQVLIPLWNAIVENQDLKTDIFTDIVKLYSESAHAIAQTNVKGIPLNLEKTNALIQSAQTSLNAIEDALRSELGEVGYESCTMHNGTRKVLKTKFDISLKSVDKDALKALVGDAKRFGEQVIEAREIQKQVAELQKYVDLAVDGVIYPQFRPHGAKTGRWTCQNPNLQQVSKHSKGVFEKGAVRALFEAPDGYSVVSADYSQIEVVINAIECGETVLLNDFEQGIDIYNATASRMFDCPVEQVTAEQRQIAKSATLGLQYGMGVEGFNRYLNGYGIEMTLEETKKLRNDWLEAHPSISAKISRIYADRPKSVKSVAGRVMAVDKSNSALNLSVQGSAADLFTLAVVNAHNRLTELGLDAWLAGYIHDEIVVVCKDEVRDTVATVIEEAMHIAAQTFYPEHHHLIRSETTIGKFWGDDSYSHAPAEKGHPEINEEHGDSRNPMDLDAQTLHQIIMQAFREQAYHDGTTLFQALSGRKTGLPGEIRDYRNVATKALTLMERQGYLYRDRLGWWRVNPRQPQDDTETA